jgi:hypothetical protein
MYTLVLEKPSKTALPVQVTLPPMVTSAFISKLTLSIMSEPPTDQGAEVDILEIARHVSPEAVNEEGADPTPPAGSLVQFARLVASPEPDNSVYQFAAKEEVLNKRVTSNKTHLEIAMTRGRSPCSPTEPGYLFSFIIKSF